jgi:hypothetical protein
VEKLQQFKKLTDFSDGMITRAIVQVFLAAANVAFYEQSYFH